MLGNTTSITVTDAPSPATFRRSPAPRRSPRSVAAPRQKIVASALWADCSLIPFQHVSLSACQRLVWNPSVRAMSDFVPFHLFSNGGTKSDKIGQNRTKSDIPTFLSGGADILVCGFPGHSSAGAQPPKTKTGKGGKETGKAGPNGWGREVESGNWQRAGSLEFGASLGCWILDAWSFLRISLSASFEETILLRSGEKVAAGRMRCGALTSSTAPRGEVSSALRSQLFNFCL